MWVSPLFSSFLPLLLSFLLWSLGERRRGRHRHGKQAAGDIFFNAFHSIPVASRKAASWVVCSVHGGTAGAQQWVDGLDERVCRFPKHCPVSIKFVRLGRRSGGLHDDAGLGFPKFAVFDDALGLRPSATQLKWTDPYFIFRIGDQACFTWFEPPTSVTAVRALLLFSLFLSFTLSTQVEVQGHLKLFTSPLGYDATSDGVASLEVLRGGEPTG